MANVAMRPDPVGTVPAAPDAQLAPAPMPTRLTYTELLDTQPMSPALWLILFGCILAQVLDGFDFEATSFALPLVIHQFHISPTEAGSIGSFTNVGLMTGGLLFGMISDRFGRRVVLQWALLLYSVGTLLSAISPNFHFLLFARFVAGVGISGEFPVAFALLAEFAPKRLRHVFVGSGSVAYSTGWFVCALVAVAIVPHLGWRSLYWVGATPVLAILFVRRYVPESVRFLLRQGRVEEAGRVARRLADSAGLRHVELVPPPTETGAAPGIGRRVLMLRSYWVAILAIGLCHLANNVQVVGFGTWLPSLFVRQGFTLTRSFTFTLIVLCTTPLGQVFGIWLQTRMRRQLALLLLAAVSAVCFFGFGLSFEYRYPIAVTVACDVAFQFFSGGVAPITSTLAAEVFPTSVRSLGYGLLSAVSRIGSICGPFILGVLLTVGTAIHQIIYYFTLPLLLAALLLAALIRADTRHKTLEEVSS